MMAASAPARMVSSKVMGTNRGQLFRGRPPTFRSEDWVMRLRQAVQRNHSDDGGQCAGQNGQLKSDGNEQGPAIQGTPPDIPIGRLGDAAAAGGSAQS